MSMLRAGLFLILSFTITICIRPIQSSTANNNNNNNQDENTTPPNSTAVKPTASNGSIAMASTLEPIYFGRYPQQHHLEHLKHLEHQHQPPDFYSQLQQHQHQHYDDSLLPNSFYYLKDEAPPSPPPPSSSPLPRQNSIAKPEFDSGGSLNDDGDVVTLQAFSSANNNGQQRPQQQSKSNAGNDDTMRLLEMLAPEKQVQLVNGVSHSLGERPRLNLVSGELHPRQNFHQTRDQHPHHHHQPASNATLAMGPHQATGELSMAGVNKLAEMLRRLQRGEAKQPEEQPATTTATSDEQEVEDEDGEKPHHQEMLNIQQLVQQQPISPPPAQATTNEDRQFLASLAKFQEAKLAEKAAEREQAEADEAHRKSSIPIDRLVDHLMANSRLSSFGVQHDGLSLPDDEEVLGDEDEEDEEEEEEPNEQEAQEEAQESQVAASSIPLPAESLGFSSVLNKSTSWIPLGGEKQKSSSSLGRKKTGKKRKRKKKRGSKSKKGKKKKKKKKKKKFGLMIGGRLLSRNDLIRLISILNKMAGSKTSSQEEREASKKLLRFLIKLMLDEYKKSKEEEGEEGEDGAKKQVEGEVATTGDKEKEPDEPIRDLLRPILEGPTDAKSAGEGIEVKPLVESSTIKPPPVGSSDVAATGAAADRNSSDTSDQVTSDQDATKEEEEAAGDKKDKRRGLSELSGDLETYFDTDFYEDMADKVDPNNANKTARPRSASGSTAILAVASGRGRKPQLLYTMPVPIYGQQLFEAADEDDTDFDQVPVRRLGARRRSTRRRHGRRRQGRSGRRAQGKKRRRKELNDAREGEEEEEEEEEEPVEEETPVAGVDQKVASSSQEGEEKLDQEPEEPSAPSSATNEADDGTGGKEVKMKKKKPKKAKSKRKVKRNKANNDKRKRKRRYRRRKDRNGILHIDYDSRYDVPPPIEAGKWNSRYNYTGKAGGGKQTSSASKLSLTSPTANNKRKLPAASNSTPTATTTTTDSDNKPATRRGRASSKKSSGTKKKKTKKRTAKERAEEEEEGPDEPPTEEPKDAAQGGGDEDYYNEGTSYSKVCDEDDKCKVSVQSSSPRLSKAIKNRDKTKIQQQLGPWLSKPD